MEKETITISIPKSLLYKIERRMKDIKFNSISDYISYVLSQSISETGGNKKQEKNEEEKVKDKLRILGYID